MPSPTKITEKQLFERRNTTDVFNRIIIAGLLKVLNKKLVYEQIWNDDNDKIENITVPFFYSFSGGSGNAERFIQDNYTFFSSNECTDIGLKKIDGNFDFLPQGRIDLTSAAIDAGNITNRFVLGRYNRRVDGQIKSFVSLLYSIPLTYQFNVEVRAENMNSAFKIDQAFREYFYKNKTFYVMYRGMRIPCRAGFPDTENTDKGEVHYQMGVASTDRVIKMTFTISVETYQPVFDPTTEMPAENRIDNISLSTRIMNDGVMEKSDLDVFFRTTDLEHTTQPAGIDLYLEWDYTSSNDDNTNLYNLYYRDRKTGDMVYIDNNQNDALSYIWHIPDELSSVKNVDVIIPNIEDSLMVYKTPKIKFAPDPKTKIVTPANIVISNKGYFITSQQYVDGYFSYVDKNGKLIDHPFKLKLRNCMIDPENPIEFEDFVYNNEIKPHNIDIVLESISSSEARAVLEDITIV